MPLASDGAEMFLMAAKRESDREGRETSSKEHSEKTPIQSNNTEAIIVQLESGVHHFHHYH